VTLLDTGVETMTGGRIKRAAKFIGNKTFMLTYGDGVADIDLNRLLKFHKSHGKAITITSVQPDGRFGALNIESDNRVTRFLEKPVGDGAWINGGFFVCEPKVLDYITEGDATIFEKTPLENLAKDGELFAYKHTGFWRCMDTLRDKRLLNEMWNSGRARWKVWE
jgi:glucose-1-phosphate cytidylyltransferase